MRGKGYDVVSRLCRVRITPACAGKRDKTGWTTTCPRDHPRMCGEKPKVMNLVLVRPGSPPHVRGKGGDGNDRGLHARITPAYAGKSSMLTKYCRATQDHPRVCGEKADAQYQLPIMQGSPPACAGKSWSNALPCSRREDHPRVCGEKFFAAYGAMPLSGSPPRMRGKD